MQTFLPYPDFARSAAVLDRQRLGKQRVENMQIMMAILGYVINREEECFEKGEPPVSIVKHWVTDMWRGHEWILWDYHKAIVAEWTSRGYKDTCGPKMAALVDGETLGINWPRFMGNKEFHKAYRSVLVQKDPDYYRQHFQNVRDDLDYIHWPGVEAKYS